MGSSGGHEEGDGGGGAERRVFWAWVEGATGNMAMALQGLVERVLSWTPVGGLSGLLGPSTTMDTLNTLLVGWLVFVVLILIIGGFFYVKFVRTLDSDKLAKSQADVGPEGEAAEGGVSSGQRSSRPGGGGKSLRKAAPKVVEVARKPTIVPDGPREPVSPPVATGADPDAANWANNIFTWLYNSVEGGPIITKKWLETVSENTVKTALETGILVEVVEVYKSTPGPVLSNMVVDCSPNDNMTITCDCDTVVYLRVITTRTQGEVTTESEYACAVRPLRGRLNIAAISDQLMAVVKFDGWPEVELELEGIRNNSTGLHEQSILDVVNEVIVSAVRNSVLDLNFQNVSTFPRFRRARQAPDKIIPVGYDSMVRELQTHPPSAPKTSPIPVTTLHRHEDLEEARDSFTALSFSPTLSQRGVLTTSEEQLIVRNLNKYPSLENTEIDAEDMNGWQQSWEENYVPATEVPTEEQKSIEILENALGEVESKEPETMNFVLVASNRSKFIDEPRTQLTIEEIIEDEEVEEPSVRNVETEPCLRRTVGTTRDSILATPKIEPPKKIVEEDEEELEPLRLQEMDFTDKTLTGSSGFGPIPALPGLQKGPFVSEACSVGVKVSVTTESSELEASCQTALFEQSVASDLSEYDQEVPVLFQPLSQSQSHNQSAHHDPSVCPFSDAANSPDGDCQINPHLSYASTSSPKPENPYASALHAIESDRSRENSPCFSSVTNSCRSFGEGEGFSHNEIVPGNSTLTNTNVGENTAADIICLNNNITNMNVDTNIENIKPERRETNTEGSGIEYSENLSFNWSQADNIKFIDDSEGECSLEGESAGKANERMNTTDVTFIDYSEGESSLEGESAAKASERMNTTDVKFTDDSEDDSSLEGESAGKANERMNTTDVKFTDDSEDDSEDDSSLEGESAGKANEQMNTTDDSEDDSSVEGKSTGKANERMTTTDVKLTDDSEVESSLEGESAGKANEQMNTTDIKFIDSEGESSLKGESAEKANEYMNTTDIKFIDDSESSLEGEFAGKANECMNIAEQSEEESIPEGELTEKCITCIDTIEKKEDKLGDEKLILNEFTDNLFKHLEVEESELNLPEENVESLPWEITEIYETDDRSLIFTDSAEEEGDIEEAWSASEKEMQNRSDNESEKEFSDDETQREVSDDETGNDISDGIMSSDAQDPDDILLVDKTSDMATDTEESDPSSDIINNIHGEDDKQYFDGEQKVLKDMDDDSSVSSEYSSSDIVKSDTSEYEEEDNLSNESPEDIMAKLSEISDTLADTDDEEDDTLFERDVQRRDENQWIHDVSIPADSVEHTMTDEDVSTPSMLSDIPFTTVITEEKLMEDDVNVNVPRQDENLGIRKVTISSYITPIEHVEHTIVKDLTKHSVLSGIPFTTVITEELSMKEHVNLNSQDQNKNQQEIPVFTENRPIDNTEHTTIKYVAKFGILPSNLSMEEDASLNFQGQDRNQHEAPVFTESRSRDSTEHTTVDDVTKLGIFPSIPYTTVVKEEALMGDDDGFEGRGSEENVDFEKIDYLIKEIKEADGDSAVVEDLYSVNEIDTIEAQAVTQDHFPLIEYQGRSSSCTDENINNQEFGFQDTKSKFLMGMLSSENLTVDPYTFFGYYSRDNPNLTTEHPNVNTTGNTTLDVEERHFDVQSVPSSIFSTSTDSEVEEVECSLHEEQDIALSSSDDANLVYDQNWRNSDIHKIAEVETPISPDSQIIDTELTLLQGDEIMQLDEVVQSDSDLVGYEESVSFSDDDQFIKEQAVISSDVDQIAEAEPAMTSDIESKSRTESLLSSEDLPFSSSCEGKEVFEESHMSDGRNGVSNNVLEFSGDPLLTTEFLNADALTQLDTTTCALTHRQGSSPYTWNQYTARDESTSDASSLTSSWPQWSRPLSSYPVYGTYFVVSATQSATAGQSMGIPGLNGKRLLVKIVKAVGIGCDRTVTEAYAVVEMDEPPQKFTTSVVKDTSSPFWDEQFLFDLSDGTLELLFELYDKKDGNFLGLGIVGIEELVATPSQRQIIPLQTRPYEDDEVSGSLTVEFLFLDRADLPDLTLRSSATSQSLSSRGDLVTTTTTTYVKAPESKDVLVNGGDGVAAAVLRDIEEKKVVVANNANKSTMIIHASRKPGEEDEYHNLPLEDLTALTTTATTTTMTIASSTTQSIAAANSLLTPSTTATAATTTATSTNAATTEPTDLDERGRSRGSRKRDSFFGTLKKRFSRSKVRSKSMDPGARDMSLDRDASVGRSVSMERAANMRASEEQHATPLLLQENLSTRLLSVPASAGGDGGSTRSSISDTSAISSSSTRTYVNEASTLIVESSENGILKHFLIPLALQQKSKWRKKGLKLHVFGEHTFIAKHMTSSTPCQVCQKTLGRRFGKQGYECRDCGFKCHKPCHVKTDTVCPNSTVNNMDLEYVKDPREERRNRLKKLRST